ncbi:MAG: GNAT family N-acetyltransferase [Candidatus Hodarchaeales archaeon]|jgi:GNAT superfamily N-acetyltransferase
MTDKKNEFDWKIFSTILEMEVECFSSFTSASKTSWGYFLCNPDYRERYDANNALITQVNEEEFDQTIDEIINYYQERHLTPRIHFYHPSKDHPFKKALLSKGFKCNYPEDKKPLLIMIYNRKKNPPPPQLEKPDGTLVMSTNNVDPDDWLAGDIRRIFPREDTFKRVIQHPHYHYFLLYFQGEPAAMITFFTSLKYKNVRVDDVITRPEYRKHGFSSFLVNRVLSWTYKKKLDAHLHVLMDNAKRIYSRAGFEQFVNCQDISWFFDPRSETE